MKSGRSFSFLSALFLSIATVSTASASTFLYGISAFDRGSEPSGIYRIEAATGATSLIATSSALSNQGEFSPNGLGYYGGSFYYSSCCDFTGDDLYSYNIETGQTTSLGVQLAGANATGAFYNNTYYYITQGGTDVNAIRVNADGTVTNLGGLGYNFGAVSAGDLAVSDTGVLYFSGALDANGQRVLMSFNLADPFDLKGQLAVPTIQLTDWFGQLAFQDNVLFALLTNDANLFTVNIGNASLNFQSHLQSDLFINDLSNGPQKNNTEVPEPASLLLLGLGGAGLLRRRAGARA